MRSDKEDVDFKQSADGTRILFCEEDERILEAVARLQEEGVVEPVLVGDAKRFEEIANTAGVDISDVLVIAIDPERYAQRFHELRKHKNITIEDAKDTLKDPAFFCCMLVDDGQADGLVCGASWPTANTLKPALQILADGHVASWLLMRTDRGEFVFGDCALNVNPTEEELSQIAYSLAEAAERMGAKPRIALLSHSTEGSASNDAQKKVMHAAKRLQERIQEEGKEWKLGGELQVDAAMDTAVAQSKAPHSEVQGDANVFVFPTLDAGNIGYKLVQRFTGCEAIGPILTNLRKPVNDLSRGCTVDEIVEVAYITGWQGTTVQG